MKKVSIYNNPCLNQKYYIEIDLETGKAIYKTNTDDFNKDYECFFIIPNDKLSKIQSKMHLLSDWNTTYKRDDGFTLDGYRWCVKIISFDNKVKEIIGENNKPLEFDDLINDLA